MYTPPHPNVTWERVNCYFVWPNKYRLNKWIVATPSAAIQTSLAKQSTVSYIRKAMKFQRSGLQVMYGFLHSAWRPSKYTNKLCWPSEKTITITGCSMQNPFQSKKCTWKLDIDCSVRVHIWKFQKSNSLLSSCSYNLALWREGWVMKNINFFWFF